MSLHEFLEAGRLHRHSATRGEIRDYILKAQRALHDASEPALSADNRFVLAYHGALAAATAVLAAAGYRPSAAGHHQTVFEVLPIVVAETDQVAAYLDSCRRRRHQALYGRVGQISQSELDELLAALHGFIEYVKKWLSDEHPDLRLDGD